LRVLGVVCLVGRRLEGRRRGQLVGRRGLALLRLDLLGLLRNLGMLRGWSHRLRLLLWVLVRLKLLRKLLLLWVKSVLVGTF
jgi:hypothetical protein